MKPTSPLATVFNFLIFSSFFIALCAVVMIRQTDHLLRLSFDEWRYMLFVFFSTLSSYNFHWALTLATPAETIRVKWTHDHKTIHHILLAAGLIGAVWFALQFRQYWLWLGISVVLTFLYSAPKLPYPIFSYLKKIAVGKTLFLTFVWVYVTTVLPVIIGGNDWDAEKIFFTLNRFFFVYSICIIFDKRDRVQDRNQGIRSMVTFLSDENVRRLFNISLALFFITSMILFRFSIPAWMVAAIAVPGFIVRALYDVSEKNNSDYLYYFILDGLMMLSAIFTSLIPF